MRWGRQLSMPDPTSPNWPKSPVRTSQRGASNLILHLQEHLFHVEKPKLAGVVLLECPGEVVALIGFFSAGTRACGKCVFAANWSASDAASCPWPLGGP